MKQQMNEVPLWVELPAWMAPRPSLYKRMLKEAI